MAPMFRFGYEKFNLDDDGMRTIFIFAENLAFHLQFVMAKKKAHLLLLSLQAVPLVFNFFNSLSVM
jgi:hypothetical protein